MKYAKDIERLVDAIIEDGVLDDEEIAVLRKKASLCDINPDELENYAKERAMIKKARGTHTAIHKKWMLPSIIIGVIIIIVSCMIIGNGSSPKEKKIKASTEITLKNPKPIKKINKCTAEVARCISKLQFGNAEYYIKSYHYPQNLSESAASLVQAYVDHNYIDEAINFANWFYPIIEGNFFHQNTKRTIYVPIYEYYMSIGEYHLASSFLYYENDTNPYNDTFLLKYSTYYEHLRRSIIALINYGDIDKAYQFVSENLSYFDDVYLQWKEYRNRYKNDNSGFSNSALNNIDNNLKPYIKETVRSKLNALIDSKQTAIKK